MEPPVAQDPCRRHSRGRVSGYLAGGFGPVQPRFHLSACGRVMAAPNGDPSTQHATVWTWVLTNRAARPTSPVGEHGITGLKNTSKVIWNALAALQIAFPLSWNA